MTRSQKLASFIEHHSFVSCFEPTRVEEVLQDPDARVIGTKWVFYNKQDDQDIVVRNKARLVAKGFSQVEGLDFGDLCTRCKT